MADQVQKSESGGGEELQAPPAEVKQESQAELPKDQNNEAETKVETVAEIKLEESKDVKQETATPEVQKEVKQDIVVEQAKTENKEAENKVESPVAEAKVEANGVPQTSASNQGDWQQRESELLKKIEELEKVSKERTQDSLMLELKVREEEIDLLKARVKNLETELQAALSKPSGKNHEMIQNIKQQHEELLSKARGMIFDKTKMVKNQELQIEALTSQIVSLKDINQITKDLLEIRNSEIQAMEDRLQAMEARFKAEKDRYALVLKRAQTSSNINDDLKKEYETQLGLFKQLREKYDQRVQALVAENERLKASLAQPNAGTSG